MNDKDFTSADALIEGWRRARKASGWKAKTQAFGLHLLPNLRALQKDLRDGTYRPEKEAVFRTCERGVVRDVHAPTVRDTVPQQAYVQAVLLPALTPYLIHDNGASLKGKGVSFTRRRFEQHLAWHIRRHGREGYALLIDFRHYFASIQHDKLLAEIERHIKDARARAMLRTLIPPGEAGLGLGSVVSQIAGIYFPTRVDTLCKTVRGVHCYDAYMDDRIVLHPSKAYLRELLGEIRETAAGLGLSLHPRKTQIIKLTKGVTFLKTRYLITRSGHIVRRLPRETITRERRKLKKLATLAAAGVINIEDIEMQYASWRGDKLRCDAHYTIKRMDKLEKELITWLKQHKTNGCRSGRKSACSARSSQAPRRTSATGK